jgi:hypothetical protein
MLKTELALLLQNEGPIMLGANVAKLLGIGERTLENRIYDKTCPIKPMFKVGNKWAAHVADVAQYIDNQRAAALEEAA